MGELPNTEGEGTAARMRDVARAVETMSEGFALFDSNECLVFCNTQFRSVHRAVVDFLVPGTPWSILFSEMSRRGGRGSGFEQVQRHLAHDTVTPIAFELSRPGDLWVRLNMQPTPEGGFVLTETDVTDIHAAAEIRGEADQLMREVLDACSAYVLMSRISDGELLYQTPASKTLFGTAKTARSYYHDPVNRSDLLADLLPTGTVDDFETMLLRADGTPFPSRVASRLIEYGGEQVMVSSIHDLTQSHAQRDEIVRVNQRMFDAIEALDQGFALFDSEHRLVLANQVYMNVNRKIATKVVPGASNADIIAAAEAQGIDQGAAGLPHGADPTSTAHYEFQLAGDRVFAATRRATSDGGFVLAWRDVTGRRAAERELVRTREASYQNEKLTALGGLLAGVAHELNNPLSVVVGQALMLREEVEDPHFARRIERVSNAAERCAKIVKTFLAMARQRPLKLAPVSLMSIIATALDVAAYGLRGVGVSVETNFDADAPNVLADEDQVAQVFINLIINAEQALQEKGADGRLVISTSFDRDQGLVTASVQDNGSGVPKHLRARIFEPFFTTKTVGEGTGVGLALCHRIIGAHAGSIDVKEAPDGGADFRVSLPAVVTKVSVEKRSSEQDGMAGLSALVVEDEEYVGEIIADMLSMFGIVPAVTRNADDALALLENNPHFDMILSDLKMPGIGGIGLFEEIERRWPDLIPRLAFITGDVMSPDAGAIVERSGRPLLEKPVAPNDLRALVAKLVETER